MNYLLTDDITGKKYNLSWDKPIPPTKEDIDGIFATLPERKVEPTPRIGVPELLTEAARPSLEERKAKLYERYPELRPTETSRFGRFLTTGREIFTRTDNLCWI